jgi:type II secretory pathway pseudopilin PulG
VRVGLKGEEGQGLIELLAAMIVLSIALMALMAGYDSAFLSLHKSAQKTIASTLANQQLELYNALSYSKIGLDATTLAGIQTPGGSYDATYVADEASLDNTANDADVTIVGCGSTANCLPIQTVTGSDGRSYRLETFVRDITNTSVSNISWTTREVTVIVRDPSATGSPEILRLTTAFDRGSAG